MLGLEHLPFNKSLGQLGLLSLEQSWPWGHLAADPSAMGKSLRRHSQAVQSNASWKDEKQEIEMREVHLNIRRNFSTVRTERQRHKLREVVHFPSLYDFRPN